MKRAVNKVPPSVFPISGGGGGSTVVKGTAVITIPQNALSHSESVTLTGCTGSMVVIPSLGPHADADENHEELLDLASITATPGTNSATVKVAFLTPTTGPVRINLIAV